MAPDRRPLALLLALALAGCTGERSGAPAPEAPLPEAPAPKAPSPEVLPRPSAEKGPPEKGPSEKGAAETPEFAKAVSGAAAAVASWVKAIDADDAPAAREALLSAKELDRVAGDGLRNILGANLLPRNKRNLEAILERGRGKEVKLERFEAGSVSTTDETSLFRETATMLGECSARLTIEGAPVDLKLDLISVGGTWKVFALEQKAGGKGPGARKSGG